MLIYSTVLEPSLNHCNLLQKQMTSTARNWSSSEQKQNAGVQGDMMKQVFKGTWWSRCLRGHDEAGVQGDMMMQVFKGTWWSRCSMGHDEAGVQGDMMKQVFKGTRWSRCSMGHDEAGVQGDMMTWWRRCSRGHDDAGVQGDKMKQVFKGTWWTWENVWNWRLGYACNWGCNYCRFKLSFTQLIHGFFLKIRRENHYTDYFLRKLYTYIVSVTSFCCLWP
jgi:hypothetical protein